MRRLIRHAPRGGWPEGAAAATVTLDFDARHRRRARLRLDGGGEALLDLERAVAMAAGDGLADGDGFWVRVEAAPEPLLEARAADPALLARLAWHLGNRHVPAEIAADAIRIRPDHVLRDMLARLGAAAEPVERPFQPEGGAYDDRAHPHTHDRGHGHGHDSAH